MSVDKSNFVDPGMAEGHEMLRLFRRGVAEALREHKRLGNSIVVWDRESKQIVQVEPEDIVIPEGEPDPAARIPS